MGTIAKYIKFDGTGDYTDFISGVSGIIASGLASGVYNDLFLYVDNGTYSGSFSITVPFSGSLSIIGSGTNYFPTGKNKISGVSSFKPNIIFKDFNIFGNYIPSGYAFEITSGCSSRFEDIAGSLNYVILNSGIVEYNNVKFSGSGVCIGGSGIASMYSSSISNYNCGIYSTVYIQDQSYIHDCATGVICYTSGTLSKSLISNCNTGYNNLGYVLVNNSTLSNKTVNLLSNSKVIFSSGSILSISGINNSGVLKNVDIYPSGNIINCFSSLLYENISFVDPKFMDSAHGNYFLKFGENSGSSLVNFNRVIDSGILVITDPSQISVTEYQDTGFSSSVLQDNYIPYIYKQGSTTIITDAGKEIQFSSSFSRLEDVSYNQIAVFSFSEKNVPVAKSFNLDKSDDDFPWDWDYKEFNTTQVGVEHSYIIPRSIVDIKNIIDNRIPNNIIRYDLIGKKSIILNTVRDYRGISYDYNLSFAQDQIVWILEGTNQVLLKQNAYTGEIYDTYPLMISDNISKHLVSPSGIIYVGKIDNKYKYISSSNPDIVLYGVDYNGKFLWINTDINPNIDLRGLRSYSDKLFITGTEYLSSVQNRSYTPVGSGVGKLFMFNNNDLFTHYIYSNSPKEFVLSNKHPTDLTFDEFNNILVLDYFQSGVIYKYRLAYDYALIESNYDRDAQVLLREYYPNVEI